MITQEQRHELIVMGWTPPRASMDRLASDAFDVISSNSVRFGVEICRIMGKCRTRETVRCRESIWIELASVGYTNEMIGKALGCSRTTVYKGLLRMRISKADGASSC